MRLELVNSKTISFVGNSYDHKNLIKAIPGNDWNKRVAKRWTIPVSSLGHALRLFPGIPVDGQIKQMYEEQERHRQRAIEIKSIDEKTVDCNVKGLKGKLYPFQAVGKAFLHTLADGEGAILAYDMGLGKSVTSLATALEWKQQGIIDHILVVCPSPLKYSTWAKEIEKWTELSYIVVDGDKPEMVEWDDGTKQRLKGRDLRAVQYQQWEFGTDIIIMNYELFLHDAPTIKWEKVRELTEEEAVKYQKLLTAASSGIGKPEKHADVRKMASDATVKRIMSGDIAEYRISGNKKRIIQKRHKLPSILPPIDDRWAVIGDEAHRLKNGKSITTRNVHKSLKPAGRKILGSGTPLENNVQELWSLVDLCRPGLLGSNYKFIERYCIKDFFGSVSGPKPEMMPELRDILAPIMLRKTKQEALPDLPEFNSVEYWVEMTAKQKELYAQLKEGVLDLGDGDFSYLEVLAQITRFQQLLDSPALLREVMEDPELPVESGKLNELANIIEDLDPKRNKFIIFSQYREMTNLLVPWLTEDTKLLPKEQVRYIKGGMKSQETYQIQQDFQEGNVQCIVMTTAGNYGLDLYKGAYVICYDQLFNPMKMEQIYSRCHRNGAKNAVTGINLLTRDSYEERKVNILARKRQLFSSMIDADDEAFEKLFTAKDLLDMI